jgi:hypothetical protein
MAASLAGIAGLNGARKVRVRSHHETTACDTEAVVGRMYSHRRIADQPSGTGNRHATMVTCRSDTIVIPFMQAAGSFAVSTFGSDAEAYNPKRQSLTKPGATPKWGARTDRGVNHAKHFAETADCRQPMHLRSLAFFAKDRR